MLDAIYAMDWRHPDDQIAFWRHKARKCAEVLIPHAVEPRFLTGSYVVDQTTAALVGQTAPTLPCTVEPVLFFRQ